MRLPGSGSSCASQVKSESRKSTRKRPRRFRTDSGYAVGTVVEALEARRLLSVVIPVVPTPAAHWTFDAGSGTTAADSSGNGHTGTLGTGVSWVAGNVGTSAISVTGTSTGVVTVAGPVINTANSFTVSAWVDLASVSGYQTVVSIAGTNVAGFFLGLRRHGDVFIRAPAVGRGWYGHSRRVADPAGCGHLVSPCRG